MITICLCGYKVKINKMLNCLTVNGYSGYTFCNFL